MKMVFVNMVLALYDDGGAAGWEAALPTSKEDWTTYWLWLSYSLGCYEASGSVLPSGAVCDTCGAVRDNRRCGRSGGGGAVARLDAAHPRLMAATRAATLALAAAFTPASDAHLPARNSGARWNSVATIVATHCQQTVAVAVRGLARQVARSVTSSKATDAGKAASANVRGKWEAAVYASAVSCLERGSDDLQGANGADLDDLPPSVRSAAVMHIAAARATTQPSHLFPVRSADALAARWWRYLPFLIAVLRKRVDKPFSLVPGASVSLHRHGTVTKAMLTQVI